MHEYTDVGFYDVSLIVSDGTNSDTEIKIDYIEAYEIVNIPDANFKSYLIGNAAINTNGDSKIQRSEAETFTGGIFANGLNISDFTGLEAFIAVTELRCSDNSFSSLDVSKNTALTSLNCSYNSLSSLDIKNITALTSLDCSNNLLSSLSVSFNTALTNLECSNNSLTSLVVSNNLVLLTLDCPNNSLIDLDLDNNTTLTYLGCNDNSISSLDISNNTALTYLNCSSNWTCNKKVDK